jgi:hypothetical protein
LGARLAARWARPCRDRDAIEIAVVVFAEIRAMCRCDVSPALEVDDREVRPNSVVAMSRLKRVKSLSVESLRVERRRSVKRESGVVRMMRQSLAIGQRMNSRRQRMRGRNMRMRE